MTAPILPIVVQNRLEAEKCPPVPFEVCISIANPRQSRACLSGFDEVLWLGFHDVDDTKSDMYQAMTLQQARQVLAFAAKYRDRPIRVHCQYGASRSVAVALFLAIWLGRPLTLRQDVLAPNRFVLRQLSLAALRTSLLMRDWPLLRTALQSKRSAAYAVVPAAIADTFQLRKKAN